MGGCGSSVAVAPVPRKVKRRHNGAYFPPQSTNSGALEEEDDATVRGTPLSSQNRVAGVRLGPDPSPRAQREHSGPSRQRKHYTEVNGLPTVVTARPAGTPLPPLNPLLAPIQPLRTSSDSNNSPNGSPRAGAGAGDSPAAVNAANAAASPRVPAEAAITSLPGSWPDWYLDLVIFQQLPIPRSTLQALFAEREGKDSPSAAQVDNMLLCLVKRRLLVRDSTTDCFRLSPGCFELVQKKAQQQSAAEQQQQQAQPQVPAIPGTPQQGPTCAALAVAAAACGCPEVAAALPALTVPVSVPPPTPGRPGAYNVAKRHAALVAGYARRIQAQALNAPLNAPSSTLAIPGTPPGETHCLTASPSPLTLPSLTPALDMELRARAAAAAATANNTGATVSVATTPDQTLSVSRVNWLQLEDDGYSVPHLGYHMLAAGQTDCARQALLFNMRWWQRRLEKAGVAQLGKEIKLFCLPTDKAPDVVNCLPALTALYCAFDFKVHPECEALTPQTLPQYLSERLETWVELCPGFAQLLELKPKAPASVAAGPRQPRVGRGAQMNKGKGGAAAVSGLRLPPLGRPTSASFSYSQGPPSPHSQGGGGSNNSSARDLQIREPNSPGGGGTGRSTSPMSLGHLPLLAQDPRFQQQLLQLQQMQQLREQQAQQQALIDSLQRARMQAGHLPPHPAAASPSIPRP